MSSFTLHNSSFTSHHHSSFCISPRIQVPLSSLNFKCPPPPPPPPPPPRSLNRRNVNLFSHKLHAKNNSLDKETNTHNNTDSGNNPSASSFLSFLCPLLKLFSGGDPSRERNYIFEEATSLLSSLARLPWGSRSLFQNSYSQQSNTDPPLSLQLFEFEACPFCRRVREAITELDLSVEIYPCPKGSVRHREMVRKFGGKEMFPFLIDLNTGASLYESSDIVKYLFQQYGEGQDPSIGLLESTLFTGWVPTLLRAGRGMTLWDKSIKEPPPKKLELFSYENNPNARMVREVLCELELPYVLLSTGEGSARGKFLLDISGSKEVPYLVDPNTGTQIGDYKKIISYVIQTYSSKDV